MMTDETLRLPIQAAPVYRVPGSAALTGGGPGIEASDWLSDLVKGIQTATNVATQVAGPIMGALGSFGI